MPACANYLLPSGDKCPRPRQQRPAGQRGVITNFASLSVSVALTLNSGGGGGGGIIFLLAAPPHPARDNLLAHMYYVRLVSYVAKQWSCRQPDICFSAGGERAIEIARFVVPRGGGELLQSG